MITHCGCQNTPGNERYRRSDGCNLAPQYVGYCARNGPAAVRRLERGVRSAGGRTPFGATIITDDSGDRPLPAWATWFAEIGAWAVESAVERSLVIAITTPARDYAAVFVACGAVHAAFKPQLSTGPWEQQFARAQRLPVDTCVRLVPKDGGKAY